jgi:hypothetical protein
VSKLEADHKRDIVAAMKKYGGYARRVEDQYAVGTLDLILSTPRTGLVLAEAKRVRGGGFGPSPRQYVEMCRIEDGGGVPLLIGIADSRFWLHQLDRNKEGFVSLTGCVAGDSFPETFELWFKQRIEHE